MPPRNPADRPATEPRTEAGRRMLHRRSYWSGNNAIREAILAIEAEAAQRAAPRAEGLPSVEALALAMAACGISDGDDDPMPDVAAAILTRLGAAPRAEGLDPHRLGGLIERAIRDSKRQSGGLLPDGWTLVEMALAYPPETPTEPSQSIPSEQEYPDDR